MLCPPAQRRWVRQDVGVDLKYRIASLTSNLGDVIELDAAGVTCIVGPNNVGKSKMLREIRRFLVAADDDHPVVLQSVQTLRPLIDQLGPEKVAAYRAHAFTPENDPDLAAWLMANAGTYGPDYRGVVTYTPKGGGSQVTPAEFFSGISGDRVQPNVAPFFLNDSSVGVGQLSSSFQPMGGEGELDASYMATLHRSREAEEQISAVFYEVFGENLIYDQATGFYGLRLGDVDTSLVVHGRFTDAYTTAMRHLPKLSRQGNGMQSFMGPVAALVLGGAQVLLLDEPETYLHPPQARALGRIIGREASQRDRQVIAVTHDRDFVVGLMESNAPLRFVRIAREGNGNRLSQVRTDDVNWIWNSAVLRYSNVLSGLFYRRVIACESDADCRFYGAVLDDLLESSEVERSANETLFVPSVGKSGIESRVRALAKLHVSIGVILDFDVLADEPRSLKRIVEALGKAWDTDDLHDFNLVKQDIVDRGLRDAVKLAGVSVLSPGRVSAAATRLLDRLNERGVYVVRAGEMESFDKTIAHQKEGWVDRALEGGLHRAAGEHRQLVKLAAIGASGIRSATAIDKTV
jgi:ABC-type enterochelin transport system ATPase subunit